MISHALENALKELQISQEEFSELIIRLLDYGVITRDESQIEGMLYDRYTRCADLIEDYLSIAKIRIQHDRKFCYVRLFPPGAVVPGMADDEHSAFNSGFRVKPTQQEVAVILTLRVEYEKSLREGLVDDKGCVTIAIESLAIALKNLLKRSLPEISGERKLIFKRLKQLRLIQFSIDADLDSSESWISIQPGITSFVSDDTLAHLYPDIDTPSAATASGQEIPEENEDVL